MPEPTGYTSRYTKKKFIIPDVIYLRCHDEYGELMNWGDDVTWNRDKDEDFDIKYVLVKDGE